MWRPVRASDWSVKLKWAKNWDLSVGLAIWGRERSMN
jgi:hypothetical protein